jgi:hypothetical protein
MTSPHTPQHESLDDWLKAFYAVSDDGTAHEAYASFFTYDATLIMGDKKVYGGGGTTVFPRCSLTAAPHPPG